MTSRLFGYDDTKQAEDAVASLVRACYDVSVCKHHTERSLIQVAHRLVPNGIRVGDIVDVIFSTGTERCVFEGVGASVILWGSEDLWEAKPTARLRHFTKKGKPYKSRSWYPASVLSGMSKVEGEPNA